MIRHNSIAKEMFSVENLKKLATSQLPDLTRQANLLSDISPESVQQCRNTSDEANGLTADLTQTIQDPNQIVVCTNVLASAANGRIEDSNFVIPIEISAEELGLSSNLSAKLSIRINVDLDKLITALSIQDEEERLDATRRVLQMGEPRCELSFDP